MWNILGFVGFPAAFCYLMFFFRWEIIRWLLLSVEWKGVSNVTKSLPCGILCPLRIGAAVTLSINPADFDFLILHKVQLMLRLNSFPIDPNITWNSVPEMQFLLPNQLFATCNLLTKKLLKWDYGLIYQ